MKGKRVFIFLAIVGIGCIAGGIVGWLYYNKPFVDIETITPDYVLTADALYSAFESDEVGAHEKYMGKILEVSGKLNEMIMEENKAVLLLETSDILAEVRAEIFDANSLTEFAIMPGEEVTVRGECAGKTMDIILVRSVWIRQ